MQQLRVVLPGLGYAVAAVVGFALLELFYRYLEWRFGPMGPNEALRLSHVWWPVAAGAYGIWRIQGYHPLVRRPYAEWLGAVPWTSQRRLPLGPVHLAWQDIVFVGLMSLINAYFGWWHSLWVACIFLGVYVGQLAIVFLRSGQLWPMCFAIFSVGLLIVLRQDALLCLGAGVASYVVLSWHILGVVPWVQLNQGDEDPLNKNRLGTILSDSAGKLGLPVARCGPKFADLAGVTVAEGFAIGALYGWLTFALTTLGSGGLVLSTVGVMVLTVARLGVYLDGYASPISLWARLVTFRWIIPGYDYVFVAPLIALSFLAAAGSLFPQQPLDPHIYASIALGIAVALLFVLGPSLEKFRLTGNHRITARRRRNDKLVQVG